MAPKVELIKNGRKKVHNTLLCALRSRESSVSCARGLIDANLMQLEEWTLRRDRARKARQVRPARAAIRYSSSVRVGAACGHTCVAWVEASATLP